MCVTKDQNKKIPHDKNYFPLTGNGITGRSDLATSYLNKKKIDNSSLGFDELTLVVMNITPYTPLKVK
jgi:hypothetical protein